MARTTPTPATTPPWSGQALARIRAVAIGTSAGGVEALSTLLPALPRDSSVSFFVVIHLPRERPSLLVSLFAPRCALPVEEAFDKQPIEPGTLYFAPPDYHLLVEAPVPGQAPHLALSVDAPLHFSRPSIDMLFESAAEHYGPRLLAIVLTGANADGSAGLAAVRRAGGLAVVQQPESALATVMPESALQRNPGSLVLPLAEMARLLQALPRSTDLPLRRP